MELNNKKYWMDALDKIEEFTGVKIDDFAKSKMVYTLRHKEAVVVVYNELAGCLPRENSRLYYHDNDKIAMYALTKLNKPEVSYLHRKYSLHHKENWGKVLSHISFRNNVEEAMLDYESARLTKCDKPYNAYESMQNISSDYQCVECDEILDGWGIRCEERREYNYSCYKTVRSKVREELWSALFWTLREYQLLLSLFDVEEAERVYLLSEKDNVNWN